VIIHPYHCTGTIQGAKDGKDFQCCTAACSTAPSAPCPSSPRVPLPPSSLGPKTEGKGCLLSTSLEKALKQGTATTRGHSGDFCHVRCLRITLGQIMKEGEGRRARNQDSSLQCTCRAPRLPVAHLFTPIPPVSSASKDGSTSAEDLVLALWNILTQKTPL